MSDLVGNPEDRFSRVAAHMVFRSCRQCSQTCFTILVTGEIYVKADLSMEYSYVFRDIEICIADRRDSWICRELTIWLSK